MELRRGMHAYPDFPHHLKVELVKGCNRKCDFCALDHAHTPKHFMPKELFEKIVNEARLHSDDVSAMGLNLHGESTLHPGLLSFVAYAREALPYTKLYLTTNGDVLLSDRNDKEIQALFDAGVDEISLDAYDLKVGQICDEVFYRNCTDEATYLVKDFYNDNACVYASTAKKKNKMLVIVNEFTSAHGINAGKRLNRALNTQGGGSPYRFWKEWGIDPSLFPLLRTCTELNKYMAIRSDGGVKTCCADGAEFVFDSVADRTIQEVWKGQNAEKIRYTLSAGRRDALPACYACNRISFRDGLWPRWKEDKWPIAEIAEWASGLMDRRFITEQFIRNLSSLYGECGIKNRYLALKLREMAHEVLENGQ
jgi:hypothetical protein